MSAPGSNPASRLFQLPPPPIHPTSLRRSASPSGQGSRLAPTSYPSRSYDGLAASPSPSQPLLSAPHVSSHGGPSSGSSSATLTPECTPSATPSLAQLAGQTEEELIEAQLRQLYEEEEIDRFLHVFANVRD